MAKRIGLQPVGSAMIADTWNYERYKTLMERDAAVLRLSVNGMSSDWPSTCIAKPGNLLLKKLFSFVSPALLSCGSVRHKPSRIFWTAAASYRKTAPEHPSDHSSLIRRVIVSSKLRISAESHLYFREIFAILIMSLINERRWLIP